MQSVSKLSTCSPARNRPMHAMHLLYNRLGLETSSDLYSRVAKKLLTRRVYLQVRMTTENCLQERERVRSGGEIGRFRAKSERADGKGRGERSGGKDGQERSGKGGKSTLSDSFPRNIHRNNAPSVLRQFNATRGHPGRVGMRLSAYFGKRLHGMLSWTHVHV